MREVAGSSTPRSPVPRTRARGLSALAVFLLAFPHAAVPYVSFAPPGPPLATGAVTVSSSVQAVDLNRDGLLDLVFKTDRGRVNVLMNLGGGRFGPAQEAAPYDGVFSAVAGDFNSDGFPDLVRVHSESGGSGQTFTILLGDRTGSFQEAPGGVTIPVTSIYGLVVGDFDGDGRLDVAILSRDAADPFKPFVIQIFPGDGEGGLGTPRLIPLEGLSGNANYIATADLNRDGRSDFIVITDGISMHYNGGPIYSLLNLGGGLFGPPIHATGAVMTALLADFNGDGIPDIVSQFSYFGDSVSVFLGDGTGGFSQTFSGSVGFFGSPSVPAAGDLDGDGHLDFVACGGMPDVCVAFPGHGDGTFTRAESAPTGLLLLADLDNDGKADVISGFQGGLYFHRNNTGEGIAMADLFIPAFVASPGAEGAYFSTTLSGTNLGDTTAHLDLTFTDADSGRTVSWTTSVLARGQQGSISPLSGLLPPPYRGTLRAHVSGASSLDVMTLLATTQTQDTLGSSGTATPAVPAEETFDGPAWIGWLAETEQDRTNLAVLNAGAAEDGDVTLRVTLFTTEPPGHPEAVLPDVVLSPGKVYQFNRVLKASGPAPRRGFARVERVAGQARFFAYGVVNDNQTSDGSYQAATPEGRRIAETRLVVPVLVETPMFGSEFVVTNVSEATKTLRIEYVAAAVAAPDRTVRFELVLPGRSQVRWESFVEALRQIGFASLLPRGSMYTGALFIAIADGTAEGLLAGARTATVGSSGRYGLFTPAIPLFEAASESAWLAGLKSDNQTRSNVALVNTGAVDDSPSLFRLEVFGDDHNVPWATLEDVHVGAKEWLQLNSLLKSVAPYSVTGFARITKTSGNNPFIAYGVNNDGARPGERTGDGSYIPMHVPRQP
jgi:hypothetical protein